MKNISLKTLINLLIIITLLAGCIEQKTDNLALCKDFYDLNCNRSMDELLDLLIEPRESMTYDSKSNKYMIGSYVVGVYDSLSKNYIRIPGFDSKVSLVESFKNCDDDCKMIIKRKLLVEDGEITLEQFKEYVQNINRLYKGIRVPEYYPYDRIISIKGHPKLREIVFELNENTRVLYYFDSQPQFKGTKKDSTKMIVQLNNHWYCKYDL